jgi:hypothetical protein
MGVLKKYGNTSCTFPKNNKYNIHDNAPFLPATITNPAKSTQSMHLSFSGFYIFDQILFTKGKNNIKRIRKQTTSPGYPALGH